MLVSSNYFINLLTLEIDENLDETIPKGKLRGGKKINVNFNQPEISANLNGNFDLNGDFDWNKYPGKLPNMYETLEGSVDDEIKIPGFRIHESDAKFQTGEINVVQSELERKEIDVIKEVQLEFKADEKDEFINENKKANLRGGKKPKIEKEEDSKIINNI